MKKYAVLLLTVLVWMSCKKKDDTPCEGGVIQIVNNSNYPFKMEVDNVEVKEIAGAKKDYYTLQPGRYNVKFIQADGFVVSPTEYEYNLEVKMCDTTASFIHKVKIGKLDNPEKK